MPPFRRAVAAATLLLAACRTPPTGGVAPRHVAAAERAAREALAAEQAIRPDTFPARSLAVAPLTGDPADSILVALGYGLTDILLTDLGRSRQLVLVERARVDALLREQQLASIGRVDSTTAPRVGRLLGARRIVVGSLGRAPDGNVLVDTRIADAATGEVRGAVSATTRPVDILDAEKRLAFRLFEEMGITLTPAERVAVTQRPTASLTALVAYGRGVRAEAEGRYDAAAAEYRNAVRADPSFGLAADRLGSVGGARPATALGGGVARAVETAANSVNPGFLNTAVSGAQPGSTADAAFPPLTVTILVVIKTTP